MFDCNGFWYHIQAKMMYPYRQMFCFRSGAVFCGSFYVDFVVIKCVASNFGSIGVDVETISFQFFEWVGGYNNLTKGG